MATISWLNEVDGAWYKKTNWDLDHNPQSDDDVVIGGSAHYTVTVVPKPDGRLYIVNSITISNPNATLLLQGPGGEAANGDVTNFGTMTWLGGVTINGVVHNHGTMSVGANYIIGLTNDGALTLLGSVIISQSAPADLLTTGTLNVLGVNAKTIGFGVSGSITAIPESLTLVLQNAALRIGVTTQNPLAGLASNAGSLTIMNGTDLGNGAVAFSNSGTFVLIDEGSVARTANLTNSGTLQVDPTGVGGTAFSIAGTLSNSGMVQVGSSGGDLAADSSVTVTHLSNGGAIDLFGGSAFRASLIDTGDAAPSTLTSGEAITLSGNAVLQYASGSIAAIADGAALSIDGTAAHVADKGQTSKNSALTGLHSNAGTLSLGHGAAIANAALAFDNSGSYSLFDHTVAKTNLQFTNGGVLALDQGAGDGGSQLKVGTALDNSGTLSVGNSALSAGDTVSAATLTNSGTITLRGGSASDKATLSITGDIANSGTMDIGVFSQINKDNTYTQTAGETDVGGTLKAATVLVQGGILQGIGTVIANINDSGGDVAGGDFAAHTLGTLHIQGKLVDSANVDATLVAETGDASLIAVSGPKVSLKGATLHLDISNPDNLTVGETFTILTFTHDTLTFGFTAITDGTHTGDGNSLDLGNGFTLEADYDKPGGHITLTVADSGSHAAPLMEPGFHEAAALAAWHADGWIG